MKALVGAFNKSLRTFVSSSITADANVGFMSLTLGGSSRGLDHRTTWSTSGETFSATTLTILHWTFHPSYPCIPRMFIKVTFVHVADDNCVSVFSLDNK